MARTSRKQGKAAEQILEAMEVEAAFLADGREDTCGWVNEFKKYGLLERLSREVVISLIAQIFVYEKKEGERYPRIEVQFKYAEEFQASLGLLEEMRKDGDLSVKEESCSGEDGTLSGHPLMQSVSHGDKEGTYGQDE